LKKVRKNNLFFTLLILVLSIFVWMFISYYNRPVDYVNKTSLSHNAFTTNQFLEKLGTSESKLEAVYVNQVIEIKGVINDITYRNNKYTLILQGEEHSKLILCEMQVNQEEKIKHYLKGEKIIIKGVYKGCLMDAIFLNCIILEKNANT